MAGFAFFQGVSASAIDYSLIPIKNDILRTLHFSELFHITRISLHCTFHGSLLFNRHSKGCRRYFAANRLEMHFDEDDSRSSSRVREH